ncbi:MAG: methyltransferase domain-containing protein [Burkholderiales bacterium]|nr:methyltransferase domain-containing protein [Burkholderiales bacterium]
MPPADNWTRPAKSWALRASPLRPAAEDIAVYRREIRSWHGAVAPGGVAALLLGVTPEIATMDWPAGTRLTAVDVSRAMIGGVWPGASRGQAAVCARWAKLPFPDGSHQVAIGDGCYSVLTADAYEATTRSLRRVLRPDGLLVLRWFTRPERPEAPARVFADLAAGRIGSFHAFKWRLAMALHDTLAAGVRLSDIWEVWHAAVPHPERLAAERGWPLPVVGTIDDFRGLATRYTFPTLAEARSTLSDAFDEAACHFPSYELGERCPVIAYRPR